MKNRLLSTALSPNYRKAPLQQNEKLRCFWSALLILVIGLIIGIVTWAAFYILPTPLETSSNSLSENFSGSKARQYLKELVALGPRPVGSKANEIDTVQFLLNRIQEIVEESKGLYEIEYEVQIGSTNISSFSTDRSDWYYAMQNVLVRIEARNNVKEGALLINSHFDSVYDSPGAGDDGSAVAIMLELLSTLTTSEDVLQHPVVFLFNGAEEIGLKGSIIFVTQHRWAQDVTTCINLEGMGVGGKEMLFNVGPGNTWLIDYYSSSAKYPYANVMGQEVFERGLIPSYTDFSLFTKYGYKGLDFAYISRGFLYHTKSDRIKFVDEGALQHTGDNILTLIRALGNADELKSRNDVRIIEKSIFFDVFGIFMINYSETSGIIFNSVVSGVSIIVIFFSVWMVRRSIDVSRCRVFGQFLLTFLLQLVSLAIAFGIIYLIAYVLDAVGHSMSWFAQPWAIFGLYFCPFIFIMGIIPSFFLTCNKFNKLPYRFSIAFFLHSNCLILSIIDIVLTIMSIRSAFLVTLPIVFYTLPLLINIAAGLDDKPRWWICTILIGQIIPLAFLTYITEIIYEVFIPITGRNGPFDNPETLIAIIAFACSLLMFGFIVPIFNIFRKAKWIISSVLIIFVVSLVLSLTSVWFPYRADTNPQRQSIDHALRTYYNQTGHIVDQKSFYIAYLEDPHTLTTLEDVFVKKHNLQLYPGNDDIAGLVDSSHKYYYYWDVAPLPVIGNPAKLTLKSSEHIDIQTYNYTFELTGSKWYRLHIHPSSANLIDWSFGKNPPSNRNEYRMNLRFGNFNKPYAFWIILKSSQSLQSSFSIGVFSRYLQEESEFTVSFKEIVSEMPNWTSTSAFITSFDRYTFPIIT